MVQHLPVATCEGHFHIVALVNVLPHLAVDLLEHLDLALQKKVGLLLFLFHPLPVQCRSFIPVSVEAPLPLPGHSARHPAASCLQTVAVAAPPASA